MRVRHADGARDAELLEWLAGAARYVQLAARLRGLAAGERVELADFRGLAMRHGAGELPVGAPAGFAGREEEAWALALAGAMRGAQGYRDLAGFVRDDAGGAALLERLAGSARARYRELLELVALTGLSPRAGA